MFEVQTQNKPVTVSMDVVWQGSSAKHNARMSEISIDGCFIDSNGQERSLGETVQFKAHLPSGPWVSLQGEVINQEYPIGFGLRFKHLTQADRGLLAQVIAAHGGGPVDQVLFAGDCKEKTVAEIPKERPRVLVADDDPLTLRMLSAIVEAVGYQVVGVKDGRQALDVLQQDANFSAAIFDMNMPHLQGLDLILYMKASERLRRIPVGMITAEEDPKVWDDSVAAGARVFLPKPFAPPQVQMMLRMLLSKPAA